MDKDLLKGLLMCVVALVVLAGVFLIVSDSGPDQASCIARAVKSGVAFGNISAVCQLGAR